MAHATTRALSLLLFFLLPLRLPIAVHCQGLATAILARMEGDAEQPGRLGPKSQEDGDTSLRGDLHPILDARVVAGSVSATGATTAHITGAPRQAKPHGAAEQGQARQKRVKRALLRATRRAQLAEDRTTLYRGRRLTLAQLGGPAPPPRAAEPRARRLPRPRGKRIRLLTKNVGGRLHDLADRAKERTTTSSCCRRHTMAWAKPRRSTRSPAGPSSPARTRSTAGQEWRYTFPRNWHATRRSDFQELVPGRLLHVRIPIGNNNQRTHLDIINFYQWAWDNDVRKQRLEKRQLVWQRLERLLTGLPRRNVRCIAGDFNCTLQPDGVQVGPGTYRASGRGAYPDSQEFQQALTTGSMCALNTWGPRRRAATYLEPEEGALQPN